MTIANLVETVWLIRYPWPVEITYGRGGEFFNHGFKNSLIEYKYGIKTNPTSPGNTQENKIKKIIHQVLGNLVSTYNLQETYVDDADPWMVILTAPASTVRYTYHMTQGKNYGPISL